MPLDFAGLVDSLNSELADFSYPTIEGDTPVSIEAWGGQGGAGGKGGFCSAGSRGSPGYARTNSTAFEIEANPLYLYVGEAGQDGGLAGGGSSSVVLNKPITDVNDINDPFHEGVFLIAGGGGGGGTCNGLDSDGGGGGDGGVASAFGPGSAASVAGGTGGKGTASTGSERGYGGNQDGGGGGGPGFFDGEDGIGGFGGISDIAGASRAGWPGASVGWQHGTGGSEIGVQMGGGTLYHDGGNGGGGFGGGGSAGTSPHTSGVLVDLGIVDGAAAADGAGGGGSWARPASTFDGLLPELGQDHNPGGGDGAVVLTFALEVIEADLSVAMTPAGSAIPGLLLTYEIDVLNKGLFDVPNAHVTDAFPGELDCVWVSLATPGVTGNTAVGAGTLSDVLNLPGLALVTYSVTCFIDAGATGNLSNTVAVSSTSIDPTPDDNTVTISTLLSPQADLSVTLDDDVTAIQPGGSVSPTIVVTNDGPSDNFEVQVTDYIPSVLSCSWTSSATAGAGGNSNSSGNLVDTLFLLAGNSVTYELSCDVDPSAQTTDDFSNSVTVSGSTNDPDTSNNTAFDDDYILDELADLQVTKTDHLTDAEAGFPVIYTIVASNGGLTTEPSALITDTPPLTMSCAWTSVASGGATGNGAGSGVLGETLSMPGGSSVTYTMHCDVDPGASGTLANTVNISGTVADPNLSNNSATDDDTLLAPKTDLTASIDDGLTVIGAGAGTVIYAIVVGNDGPEDDPGAMVGTAFDSFLDCSWTAVAAGFAVGNTSGSGDINESVILPVGGTMTYTATCPVDASAGQILGGSLSSTVTVTGSGTESDASDNSATDNDTQVQPEGLFTITKTDGVTSASPGETLTYTVLVSNPGPGSVYASVDDTLPDSLFCNWTHTTTGGADVSTATNPEAGAKLAMPGLKFIIQRPTEGNLIQDLVWMPAGSTVTYTIDCDIDAGAPGGTLSNTAVVTSAFDAYTILTTASATDDDTVLTPEVDLSITNSDSLTNAQPGDTVVYTLVGSNLGPSDEPAAIVADTPSVFLTLCSWTSVATGGASGNSSGSGTLSESLNMPAGSTVTYTKSCTIGAGASGTVSNTATIAGTVNETDLSNNAATDETEIAFAAEVSISKDDQLTEADPGDTLVYTIVAANAGQQDDPSVSVSDTPPPELDCSWTSVAAGGATGNSAAAGNLNDTLNMPAGSSVTYTMSCDVDGNADGTVTNTAVIVGSFDGDESNNSATDDDTVLIHADLSITKTDGVVLAQPGTSVVYTVVVANAGPDDDPAAMISDSPPSFLSCSWISVAAGGASGNSAGSGNIADTLNLPAASSVTYTVTCAIDANALGTLVNTAAIAASVADLDLSNNSATDDNTVLDQLADLSITKTDGVTLAEPGETVVYTLVAANAGPTLDNDVTLADTPPADLSCQWVSIAAGGADGPATGNTLGSGNLADTLYMPAGSSVTYTMTCDIDPGASGTLSNTATIATSLTDPDPGNNSATDADTMLSAEADVSITKDDGVTQGIPGDSVIYTVVVGNAGPSDDPLVTVTDTEPSALSCSWTSVGAGGASGNTSGSGDLADTLNLPVGASVTYTITCAIDVDANGTLSNTALASGSISDPDPANNSATDNNTVLLPQADISISKDDAVTLATPGLTLVYDLAVRNAGPSADPAVTVADVFPGVLTCAWTSDAIGGATGGSSSSGDLNDVLNMPVGSSVHYTVTCDIDPDASGPLSNTATSTSSVDDPDPSNNSATDDDTVLVPRVDLAVTKDDRVTSAAPGSFVIYYITVDNPGPSDDPSVLVSDNPPPELDCTWTSGSVGGATGNTNGSGDLNDTLNMPAGSSVIYTMRCAIDLAATGVLANTVELGTSADDRNFDNQDATDDDTVLARSIIEEIPTLDRFGQLLLGLLLLLFVWIRLRIS